MEIDINALTPAFFFFGLILCPFCQVLLMENDINARPFTAQVLACLPPLPWTCGEAERQQPQRQDLRHLRVFSVDPRVRP